jgi:beta-glucanase (GH16 family)
MDFKDTAYPWDGKWQLVWSDEFKTDRLNIENWNIERRNKNHNDEQQFYLEENISFHKENGNLFLRISTLKEDKTENGVARNFTSGLVQTRDKHFWLYGRFEVRARLPKTRGIWPAHWMLPQDNGWPPEIDIMEMLGDDPHKVYTTLHWRDQEGHHFTKGDPCEGPDYSLDFHTFAVEWEPGVLRWYVDDKCNLKWEKDVPDKPFYIILNTAVGGPKSWPGPTDESTVFPQYHDIDYVRVFQRK